MVTAIINNSCALVLTLGLTATPPSAFPMVLPSRWEFLHFIKGSETQIWSEPSEATEVRALRTLRFKCGLAWFPNLHSVYKNKMKEKGGR